MDFIAWLLKQNKRPDSVGWLSRLIADNTKAQQELQKSAGADIVLPRGKIESAIVMARQEWKGECKIAGRPQIGIFWIMNGQVVPFSEDAFGIEVGPAGFKDVPFDHYNTWGKMIKMYPGLAHREYADIPRGRVIGIGKDRYRLFMSPADIANKTLVARVMGTFNLPGPKTELKGDSDYVIDNSYQWSQLKEDSSFDLDDAMDDEDPFE